MAKREGYARSIGPDKKSSWESGTITCAHCNGVVHLHDAAGRMRSNVLVHCHQCDERICVPCAEKARCEPFEKKLEAMEGRRRLREAIP